MKKFSGSFEVIAMGNGSIEDIFKLLKVIKKRGYPLNCVNGIISVIVNHSIFKENGKMIHGYFPVLNGHSPLLTGVFQY